MKKIILPLIVSLVFFSESLFADIFSEEAFAGRLLVPHFLLIILTMMVIYYFRNTTLIYAAVFGLLYDVYFTGIIGVYLFLFPIVVYITTKIMKAVHTNFLTVALVMLINITLVEFAVYGLYVLILDVKMGTSDFLHIRLWPTLILNTFIYIIFSVPLSRWLQRRKKELLSES